MCKLREKRKDYMIEVQFHFPLSTMTSLQSFFLFSLQMFGEFSLFFLFTKIRESILNVFSKLGAMSLCSKNVLSDTLYLVCFWYSIFIKKLDNKSYDHVVDVYSTVLDKINYCAVLEPYLNTCPKTTIHLTRAAISLVPILWRVNSVGAVTGAVLCRVRLSMALPALGRRRHTTG